MFRSSLTYITRRTSFIRFNSTDTYTLVVNNLKKDLKDALLNKNEIKKTTIRNMMAVLKNKTIESKDHSIDAFGIYSAYDKMINQRRDSIVEYYKNDREDLMEKEEKELNIIKEYQNKLPVISKEDLASKVKTLLETSKTENPKTTLKEIFSTVDWKTLSSEWKASPNMIKSSIVEQYKKRN